MSPTTTHCYYHTNCEISPITTHYSSLSLSNTHPSSYRRNYVIFWITTGTGLMLAPATFNYNTLLIKLKVMAITAQYAMPCANVMPNDDFGPEGDRDRDAPPGNGHAPSARPQGHHLSVSGQWVGAPHRDQPPSVG